MLIPVKLPAAGPDMLEGTMRTPLEYPPVTIAPEAGKSISRPSAVTEPVV